MYFYDTCALLNELEQAFREPFYIADTTLYELEEIKVSKNKDDDVKAKARRLCRLLNENFDKYTVIRVHHFDLPNDQKIIKGAEIAGQCIFKTADLACRLLAVAAGLQVEYETTEEDNYLGYKKIIFETEDDTIDFYNNMLENKYDLLENEYLFIYVKDQLIDKYRWTSEGYKKVPFPCFDSKTIGKLKPKDEYQMAAMDSLKHNQFTVLRGPAGTGKSLIAMSYLMECLEKGVIDKIIVFCNTVATAGSARLGFYPGDKNSKLLDSQIGNFLVSKLGSMSAVEQMIANEQLLLIPMSDCRGMDTTGMRAGIYFTEAQNMNIDMMKLFLQRIGEDCICIVDGDDNSQVDMECYAGNRNGMKRLSQVFRGCDFYGEIKLQSIYRSRIAKKAEEM